MNEYNKPGPDLVGIKALTNTKSYVLPFFEVSALQWKNLSTNYHIRDREMHFHLNLKHANLPFPYNFNL
jgi:hypothetical protein